MNGLKKLYIDNRKAGSFNSQRIHDHNGQAISIIYLYDMIVPNKYASEFYGGVDPETFATTLKSIKDGVIHLRINSPGGDVFAARAIEQALREHPAKVIAHIDGYAASAASFIAMAADEIVMSEGAFFMIHKAWTMQEGNSGDLMSTAALLEQIDSSLVKTYANRTGQSEQDIAQWMAEETWMGSQESIDRGFADRIEDGNASGTDWNLAAYAKAMSKNARTSRLALSETGLNTTVAEECSNLILRLRLASSRIAT